MLAFNTLKNSIKKTTRSYASTSKASLDPAKLIIKGGPTFNGLSFGAPKSVSGEAVFTTSLVGYPESMTDPSYRGQIICFTQPLIGNYGVPSGTERDHFSLLKYFESPHIQCSGIVVTDVALEYSHWTAVESISEWCKREGVAGITGVDTRELVTYLREQGSSLARLSVGNDASTDFYDPGQDNMVAKVTTKEPFHVPAPNAKHHVLVVDCGAKENILRCLVSRGADITVVPFNYPIHKVADKFDGIFISNGPGDPIYCAETVENLKQVIKEQPDLPLMGICMGHQLLSLAAGAKTLKLKYGNRAHNIPTLDLTTGHCHITSQNHGYAVDANTLTSDYQEYFINLNDSSNEGMMHKERPIFSVQFHPEAKGGPLDSAFLFDKYFQLLDQYKVAGKGKNLGDLAAEKLPNARVW